VTRRILSFTHPQRFVVGTVGEPGDRTFFLQVSDPDPVSVICEKEQAGVLAEKVVELLDEIRRRGVDVPTDSDEALIDNDALTQPIEAEFRVVSMGIGWDPEAGTVIIEAHAEFDSEEVPDIGDDSSPGPDTLRVRMTPHYALAFAQRASRVVSAGRPQCPFCHLPIDADGHICPRANGYRRSVT
jgi:uncharacterized repeat protein (TIGR03847 family)